MWFVIDSRYTHPKIGRTNLEIRLLIVKLSFAILDIFGVTRATGYSRIGKPVIFSVYV
jgi:hypothetical protein